MDPLGKVLLAPGGTLAIGMALKLARVATGRHKTVSMWDAFHGASLDAISVGGEAAFRRDIGPLLPGTEHVPPCDPRACRFGCGGACDARCADYVDYVLEKEQDVAAVIVETVRCTDVQLQPPAYYKRLREACDRHGALLILDEVPIGLGRTGTMFAFERYGIVPDMVVLGKGLGGAVFPMAALIARPRPGRRGRPRARPLHAREELGRVRGRARDARRHRRRAPVRARPRARRARPFDRFFFMHGLADRHPIVGDVRGVGLLLGLELRYHGERLAGTRRGSRARHVRLPRARPLVQGRPGQRDRAFAAAGNRRAGSGSGPRHRRGGDQGRRLTAKWLATDLAGKTLGPIGVGEISASVALMAGQGFRMRAAGRIIRHHRAAAVIGWSIEGDFAASFFRRRSTRRH